MQVKEIMTTNAECTRPEATLQEATDRMKSLNVGSLPVCGDDRLVGIITDRDITVRATAKGNNPMVTPVSDIMTPHVAYCFEDDDVAEAARIMSEKQIRRLAVLNRDKRLVGIVSLGDMAVDTGNTVMAGTTLEAVSEPAAPRR
jgi:CBS domain-containing protein